MYIPNEILVIIFSELNAKSLLNTETVCKDWKRIIHEKNIWSNLICKQKETYTKAITSKEIYKRFFFARKEQIIYSHDVFYLVGKPTIIKSLLEHNMEFNNLSPNQNKNFHCYKMSFKHLFLNSFISLNKYYLFDNVRDAGIYSNYKKFCHKKNIFLPAIFKVKLISTVKFNNLELIMSDSLLTCIEVVEKNSITLVSGSVSHYEENFMEDDTSYNTTSSLHNLCSIL